MPARGVVFNDLPLYGAALLAVMNKANRIGAEATVVEMRREILSGPKTGVVYTSGPQPLPHQASAPGEAPANWTGVLAATCHVETAGNGRVQGAVAGGVAAPYAAALEFGSSFGNRVTEPRPFMEPAGHVGAVARDVYIAEVTAKLDRPGRGVPNVG